MALYLKLVRGRGYATYNRKELKKGAQRRDKEDEEATAHEEQEAPVLLVTHINNILHSIRSNVEVYINNRKTYKSNGLNALKFYILNNFNHLRIQVSFAIRGVRL